MPSGVYTRTEDTRRKMSESHKGKSNWMKGLTSETDERVKKLSESNKLIVGEKSPRYKDGRTEKARSWRDQVLERYDHKCIKCDVAEVFKERKDGKIISNLLAHHLYSKKEYQELRFILDNGASICRTDHQTFHKLYDKSGLDPVGNFLKFVTF